MRHQDKLAWRNGLESLINFGKIKTTKTKVKEIKIMADKLITAVKKKTNAQDKVVSHIIPDKNLQKKLRTEILVKLQTRNSGYTKTVKIQKRKGDDAEIVELAWIYDPETKLEVVEQKKNVKINKTK